MELRVANIRAPFFYINLHNYASRSYNTFCTHVAFYLVSGNGANITFRDYCKAVGSKYTLGGLARSLSTRRMPKAFALLGGMLPVENFEI